jgi:hypothetical protein
MFETKNYTVYRHINTFIPLVDREEGKKDEKSVFQMFENVHNALNTIKCDNMAGCLRNTNSAHTPTTLALLALLQGLLTLSGSAFCLFSHSTTQHQIYPSHLAFKYRGFLVPSSCTEFLQGCFAWMEKGE